MPDLATLIEENKRLRAEIAHLSEANRQVPGGFEQEQLQDRRHTQSLHLMFDVAARVASTLDLAQLLPTIMQEATRVLNAEASALILADEQSGDLQFEVALGEKGEQVKRIRLQQKQGIAGWVFQHGKTALVPDVDRDARHAKEIATSVGFRVKSILCSPLCQSDRIIGVVEVLNKLGPGGPSFSEEDILLFEAFAHQAATAISQARAHRDLQELFHNTIGAFSATLDARDPYTYGHSERVTEFSLAIAEEAGLPEDERRDLRLSGLLHDVGKIGVPDAVLLKAGKLTAEEYAVMKQHPVIGYNIVKTIKQLKNSLDGIRHHHERMDGLGYPDGLEGEKIPMQGRIIAVADWFDAVTSARSYRERYETKHALKLMVESKGVEHDPRFVDALVAAYQKGKIIEQVRRQQTVTTAP